MDHPKSRRTRVFVVLLAVGAGLAAPSCHRLFATRIAAIESNLARYDGRTVYVFGKVKERIDLPMVKCYVVDDGSGTIGVVTGKPLPHIGDTVNPKGRVNASFKIGKRPLIALIEPMPPAAPRPKAPPKGKLPS